MFLNGCTQLSGQHFVLFGLEARHGLRRGLQTVQIRLYALLFLGVADTGDARDGVYFPEHTVQPCLRVIKGLERLSRHKGGTPHNLHRAFHRSFLPARTGVAEPFPEPVVQRQLPHGPGGILDGRTTFPAGTDGDGDLHVVIHHRLGNTLYLNGKVAVRLHQRECVLSSEQPCAATVGVQKREDGHLHLHAPPPPIIRGIPPQSNSHSPPGSCSRRTYTSVSFAAFVPMVALMRLTWLQTLGWLNVKPLSSNIVWMPLHVHCSLRIPVARCSLFSSRHLRISPLISLVTTGH